MNESRAFEAVISIEESDLTQRKKDNLLGKVIDDLQDAEASSLENYILFPVKLIGLFVISYLDNPLMKTLMKYFIVASSLVFTIITLELVEAEFWVLCVAGLILGLACLIMEILKVPENVIMIIYEIISVFAAIGFLGIFAGMIVDFIQFLAFYFSLDPVILNSLLLSIGNNVGDFFGNGALAKSGEEVMGGFATYSG